jgi:hypothetical protein
MTILTHSALKNFSWQVLLTLIFHLIEMAGGTKTDLTKVICLFGLVYEILFWIGIRAIQRLAWLYSEAGMGVRTCIHAVDQMAGGTTDPLDLRLTSQNVGDNLLGMLREDRHGRYMARQACLLLIGRRIRLVPETQDSSKNRRLKRRPMQESRIHTAKRF